MASVEHIARQDLIHKISLEKSLVRELNRLNNIIVRKTEMSFARDGLAFDASTLEPEFKQLLANHYEKTSNIFSHQINDALPSDIVATPAEITEINQALAIYFVARSAEQATLITVTNQKDIGRAISVASEMVNDNGIPLARINQARGAAVLTATHLKGRQQTISTTETQNAAETAKATEADVLAGKKPSITVPSRVPAAVLKEWVSVGDQNVRDSHVAADSQTQDVAIPFTVEGELLRYPGDTSLGASAGNVINCRCSSVVKPDSFIAIRRKPGFPALIERDPSQQLLTSLG